MNRVVELLTRYNPRITDFSPVQRWIDEGCDLEKDILPVLREWTARKPDIYSLGFFTRYVRQAKEERETREKPADIHQQARAIAFLIRRLGRCMPAERRWLDAYEAGHGKIDF